MTQIFVITGQTATGKTTHAIQRAKENNGEIISADSRQIYRGMDIITGKDKEEFERELVVVHMIDIISPDIRYSSYDFVQEARSHILSILKRGKTPIIAGGTYLYIKQLIDGIDALTEPDAALREELEKQDLSKLQEIVKSIYQESKEKLDMNTSDWNNPRRLIRRIELMKNKTDASTLPPLSTLIPNLEIAYTGFKHRDKEGLIKAITKRVEDRLKLGAIAEVESLLKKGYIKTSPGLQTIGYKQIIDYLENKASLEQTKAAWITKEVQYAKRQYTFMKVDERIEWKEV